MIIILMFSSVSLLFSCHLIVWLVILLFGQVCTILCAVHWTALGNDVLLKFFLTFTVVPWHPIIWLLTLYMTEAHSASTQQELCNSNNFDSRILIILKNLSWSQMFYCKYMRLFASLAAKERCNSMPKDDISLYKSWLTPEQSLPSLL